MKILIVGVPRSGTTALLNAIGYFRYKMIGEPFNHLVNNEFKYQYPMSELETYKNLCIKSIVLQKPFNVDSELIDFYFNWSKSFDRIILLDRLDTEEHISSFLNLWYRLETGLSIWDKWQEDDVPIDWVESFKQGDTYQSLFLAKEILLRLSGKLQIPITWYEDLYGINRVKSEKIIRGWGLDINSEKLNQFLHPKSKLKMVRNRLI